MRVKEAMPRGVSKKVAATLPEQSISGARL
jgi:hypothetical protein